MRRLALGGTWLLAAVQTVQGVWALGLPELFWSAFPLGAPGWVNLLPPYNEHLVRDVGGLSLALAVVLVAAALRRDRASVRVAALAVLVVAVPHALFHETHLEHYPASAAIGQTIAFTAQLAVAVAVLIAGRHLPRTLVDQTALRWSATGSTTDPARRSS